MPVAVAVEADKPTPEEVLRGETHAAVTSCPACGAVSRHADVNRPRARRGAVAALRDRCTCRLLPRFFERVVPEGVSLWSVDGRGVAHRLEMIGWTLHTPQWVVFADPVDAVRVVAADRAGLPAAEALADTLRNKGFAVRVGVGSPDRCGDKLWPIPRKKRAKKKAVKA